MLRVPLLFLTVTILATFAQTPSSRQAQADAAQALARTLRDESARYVPNSPQVKKSETLIRILETQSKLLQQPASERDKMVVADQIEALTEQIEALRLNMTRYLPKHPEVERSRSLISALDGQCQSLQR